jgi:cobalamin biosynthesis protein CobC
MSVFHGGDLEAAEKTFAIEKDKWLDLSTGINPRSWPVPTIPVDVWRRLPTLDQELIDAAKTYYQCDSLLAIPGSQFAIQALPHLFPLCTVAIPVVGYQEHKAAWVKAGHDIIFYSDQNLDELDVRIETGQVDIVVVINPNNPSCRVIEKKQLESWLINLKEHNGHLIIDETFMDTMPEYSMTRHLDADNFIILRSLGKFFGLAGMRLGFMLAQTHLCEQLQQQLGPWAVSGPAQWIAIQALADKDWHENNRQWLNEASIRLKAYLEEILDREIISIKNTPLYVTLMFEKSVATAVFKHMGKQGILIRLIPLDNKHACLRFGLLDGDEQWLRFKKAILTFTDKNIS